MVVFCLGCWAENAPARTTCVGCGAPLEPAQSFDAGLIAALRHPESATPVRVAWLLAERQVGAAIEPLRCVLRERDDPYLLEAACMALGRLGASSAEPELLATLQRGPLPARCAAAHALGMLGTPGARAALARAAEEDPRSTVRGVAQAALAAPPPLQSVC